MRTIRNGAHASQPKSQEDAKVAPRRLGDHQLASTADHSGGVRSGRSLELDGVRALAALAVVLFHVGTVTTTIQTRPYGAALAQANVGVTLFLRLVMFSSLPALGCGSWEW